MKTRPHVNGNAKQVETPMRKASARGIVAAAVIAATVVIPCVVAAEYPERPITMPRTTM